MKNPVRVFYGFRGESLTVLTSEAIEEFLNLNVVQSGELHSPESGTDVLSHSALIIVTGPRLEVYAICFKPFPAPLVQGVPLALQVCAGRVHFLNSSG